MKKLLISTALFTVPLTCVVQAQTTSTSNANTAGTLPQIVSEQERQIAELKAEIASLRSQLNLERRNNGKSALPVYEVATQTITNTTSSASTHTVKAGDTFSSISRKYGVSLSALIAANPSVKPTKIAINQKLVIPQSNSRAIITVPANQTETHVKVSSPKSASMPVSSNGSKNTSTNGATYKVVQGDTFYGIAKRHNITLAYLTAANPSVNPNTLRVGQNIRLNDSALQAAPSSKAAPVKKSTEAYKPLPEVVQKAPTPAPVKAPKPVSISTSEPETTPSHVQQSGDVARTVSVSSEMTFGAFAKQHGTTISILNALNGLNLPADEPMAAGSELFIPNK